MSVKIRISKHNALEAMPHNANSCIERPRKRRAISTSMHIVADEKIEKIELDYARAISERYKADNEDGLKLDESDYEYCPS